MPVVLLATQCPLPVIDTALATLTSAENTTGANGLTARTFAAGNTVISSKLNRNAKQMDLQSRYGGGGYGIVNGLALSAGSGLTLNIAAGQANIDGIIGSTAAEAATTLAVPDNHPSATDRVWIWLSRAGAISSTLNTTPPATNCCLLGSCTTSGGVITAVDTSGVVYLRGGQLWRETADTGPPGDSPNAAIRLFTLTWGGVYEWTGTAHKPFYATMNPNKKVLGNGEAAAIGADEQVVVYGGVSVTGTGSFTITGTGELIVV